VSLDALDPVVNQVRVVSTIDTGPLGVLPRLSHRQVRLQERLAHGQEASRVASALAWLHDALGVSFRIGPAEVLWRASGLNRSGVVAQISWPRLASRMALGIETPLAHALVDRLLGYDRLSAEGRLQVTPVEWGIITFVIAETLARLADEPSALGPADYTLDRVGPDPLNPDGIGEIVTLRWPVRLGAVSGAVRLWLPEALVALWLASAPLTPPEQQLGVESVRSRFGELTGEWHARAGAVSLPRGLGRMRVGGVLPIDGAPLRGTPQSPSGAIELVLADCDGRSMFPAKPAPGSGGRHLTLTGTLHRDRVTREAIAVSASPPDPSAPGGGAAMSPADVPVTLAVELGRINLPLRRLADLKPGDVIELGRHAREPVELTSGGRLIARGELVQIDTELGVRVLSVFL